MYSYSAVKLFTLVKRFSMTGNMHTGGSLGMKTSKIMHIIYMHILCAGYTCFRYTGCRQIYMHVSKIFLDLLMIDLKEADTPVTRGLHVKPDFPSGTRTRLPDARAEYT